MQNYRNATDLSQADRQRVLGQGISKFFGGLSKTGHGSGFNGALSALNASFDPAMEAVQKEESRLREINANAFKMAMKQQEDRIERAAMERKLAMEERRIAEAERHNKSMEGVYQGKLTGGPEVKELKEAAKQIKELTGDNVTPLAAMPTSLQKEAEKRIAKANEKYEAALNAKQYAERIKNIVERNPGIMGNFKYIAQNAVSEDPNYLNQAIAQMALSEKDRTDLAEMGSLVKNLLVTDLKKIPGGGNMMLDKMLRGATAGAQMPPEAIKRLSDRVIKSADHTIKEDGKVVDYAREGLDYRSAKKEYEEDHIYLLEDIISEHPEYAELAQQDPEGVIKAFKRFEAEKNNSKNKE
jgi:hypothetical protein